MKSKRATYLIFLDANVPMYLVGQDEVKKKLLEHWLGKLTAAQVPLLTDAEVFQEILHRFVAIRKVEAIQLAFDALSEAVDEIYPIRFQDVDRAKFNFLAHPQLSARDAIHFSVMQARGISEILTFDAGYDNLPGIVRLPN